MRDSTILHVDMDAFYASVMIRDRPDLHHVPVIVGGAHRGVVLSANYPARARGVHSAMSSTRARRVCPEAVVISPDYDLFSEVSASVMETFRQITPVVEVLSMDEAFLDVAGSVRRLGPPEVIATELRHRIYDEQRVPCSVGIAPSLGLAKLASRRAKPDGLVKVSEDEVTTFLHPLDVGELWGVGEKTAALLHRLGLVTVGDVAHTPVEILRRAIGHSAGTNLHRLAWGIDDRTVSARRGFEEPGWKPDKSMGADETFSRDTDDPAVIRRELLRLSAKVAVRMRSAGMVGRTITIRVRFADFTTITRTRTRAEATDVTQEIYQSAAELFAALGLQRARIRLVGVRVEGLAPRTSAYRQLELGGRERGWSEADQAADRAALRFGSAAVQPASLLRPGA